MNLKTDLRSKVLDGIGTAALMIGLLAVLIGLIFVARIIGEIGFITYFIVMVSLAGFSLNYSLRVHFSELAKAWYGIIGGMTAWTGLEIGEMLELVKIGNMVGVYIFILTLVAFLFLWEKFPLGVRFFTFIFFLNWGGHLVIRLQEYLTNYSEVFEGILTIYFWMALLMSILLVYWILMKSKTRLLRMYAAGWLYLSVFTFLHIIFFY